MSERSKYPLLAEAANLQCTKLTLMVAIGLGFIQRDNLPALFNNMVHIAGMSQHPALPDDARAALKTATIRQVFELEAWVTKVIDGNVGEALATADTRKDVDAASERAPRTLN